MLLKKSFFKKYINARTGDKITSTIMATIPRKKNQHEFLQLQRFIRDYDIKKWVIGAEQTLRGYKHWQIRFSWRRTAQEATIALQNYGFIAHTEEASDVFDYERKEGKFWASTDTKEIRQVRFGKMRPQQWYVWGCLQLQGIREITVWLDPIGCKGKTWLQLHLWETGQAHVLLPNGTSKNLIQDVASKYNKQYRPYLVIDIPRTWEWTDEILYTIEKIKDGLISDTRYSATDIDIRGVKILVLTNQQPPIEKLSEDRWDIINGITWMRYKKAEDVESPLS